MGKETNSFDYRTFASYLLPKDILKFFEVTDIEEEHTGQLDQTGTEIVILRISLDELDNREQLGLDLRPNGFTEGCDVTDFPIRDHKVVLRIRRRRWLDADGHNAVFNNYELTAAGTSYSKEFADVLKDGALRSTTGTLICSLIRTRQLMMTMTQPSAAP